MEASHWTPRKNSGKKAMGEVFLGSFIFIDNKRVVGRSINDNK